MAENETHDESQDSADQRIASLEAGQSSLEGKVDKILGIISGQHGTGEGDGGGHDDQPSGGTNVAEEIRAQLDARDAKNAADADEKSKSDRLAAAEAKIAELAEKPPAPMPRRSERIMGWR